METQPSRTRTKQRWLWWFVPLFGLLTVAVPMTYAGWGTRHPSWNAALEYPNRDVGALTDPSGFTSAAVCGGCHKRHYDEWRESAMGRSVELSAFLIDLYEVSLDVRGAPADDIVVCLQCHAPLAVMGDEPDLEMRRALSREGITCDVCHTAVAAHANDAPGMIEWDPEGPKRGPLPGPDEAPHEGVEPAVSKHHATRYSPLFESSNLCGTCHMSLWPSTGVPIDWTYPEWERSAYADRDISCQSCHMPTYRGVAAPGAPERDNLHSHSFPGGGDLDMVRRTAEIEVTARSHFAGHEVEVKVENTGAGHAFPTGNASFPVVELMVRAFDAEGKQVFTGTREYRVTYIDVAGEIATDPTAAVAIKSDTALQPLQPRYERFYIAKRLRPTRVEVELVYHRWNKDIFDNHGGRAWEQLQRFLREGVRLHRFLARLGSARSRFARVRAVTPIVVAEHRYELPPPPPPPAYLYERSFDVRKMVAMPAASLYARRCLPCHGGSGGGDGPAAATLKTRPRDFRDAEWNRSVTDADMDAIILGGGHATGKSDLMPANPDLADRPGAVVALRRYVRSFARTDSAPSAMSAKRGSLTSLPLWTPILPSPRDVLRSSP